jgi:hypothetical protein
MRSLQKAPQATDPRPKWLNNRDFTHRRHQSFNLTFITQKVTQHTTRLTIIATATVSQPLLFVLLLDLHIYPVSVFCFLTSMSTGGRRQDMLRDYGAGEDSTTKDLCAQATVAIIFFLRASGHENFFFPKRRRFLDLLDANGRSTALLCSAGVITGWLGFTTEEKNGSRTEGCDAGHSARSDSRHMAGGNRGRLESRAEVVVVVT